MLFNFLYNTGLLLLALIALPKALYEMITKDKYRTSLGKRLGSSFPEIEKEDRPLIWIHAVSFGETKAIVPLVKLLKSKFRDPIIVISSASETGHAEAKRSMPFAEHHVYMPLDFNWIIRPIIKKVKPDLVILTESDFWYNFLRNCKNEGALIALANGKISEKSTNRIKKFPIFGRKIFSLFDVMCVQSRLYQKRFVEVGAPSEKIVVTGNVKFDDDYPHLSDHELMEWKSLLGIGTHNEVLVAGSTHDPEEKLFLSILDRVWIKHPDLKLILVPRHPERFQSVAQILEISKIPFIRFSEIESKTGKEKVILLDAMGLLKKSYQIADVAIVAGSYTEKVGGHNILEPSWYGVPVIYGPHMHSQPDLVDLTKEYGTGIQVEPKDLPETIMNILMQRDARDSYVQASKSLLRDCKGATLRTWEAIEKKQI